MLNIPIYRAKKQDSDEYIEFNYYFEKDNKFYAINRVISQLIDGWFSKTNVLIPLTQKIDATTLAIHFPDMLDSHGNKIFASLSEDGKGGDIIRSKFNHNCIVKYREYFFYADNKEKHINCFGFKNSTVIGIQK